MHYSCQNFHACAVRVPPTATKRNYWMVNYFSFYGHRSDTFWMDLVNQLSQTPFRVYSGIWSPHHAEGISKLEAVQCRASKMIMSLCNKFYEEKLAWLNLFSLEKRRHQGKLIECFKILEGFTNVDADKLFSVGCSSWTRSNGIKLRCRQTELNCTKFFFTNYVVREWNKLSPSMLQCNTINSLKN